MLLEKNDFLLDVFSSFPHLVPPLPLSCERSGQEQCALSLYPLGGDGNVAAAAGSKVG